MTNKNRQTIRRAKHGKENPYFLIARETAQDKNLSFEALGLLTYLLSKPAHWRADVKELQRAGAGRDKVNRILKELVQAGYATAPKRYKRPDGKWDYTPYEFYEVPITEKPSTEKPLTAEPSTVEPSTDFQGTLESTEVESTEEEITEERDAANAALPSPTKDAFMRSFEGTPLYTAYLEAFKEAGRRAPVSSNRNGTIHEYEGLLSSVPGATPETVKAYTLERLAKGRAFPFSFLPQDMPGWLDERDRRPKAKPVGATVDMSDLDPSDPDYWRAFNERMAAAQGVQA